MRFDEPRIVDLDGLVRSPRVLLVETEASAAATVSFTNLGTLGYLFYEVEIKDLVPDTDGVAVRFRFSTDNGASYIATAYDRLTIALHSSKDTVVTTAQASFHLCDNSAAGTDDLGTGQNEKYYASVFVFPLSSSIFPGFSFFGNYLNSSATRTHVWGGGLNDGITTPPNAVEFAMSSGNIASGNFKLFGWGWRGR